MKSYVESLMTPLPELPIDSRVLVAEHKDGPWHRRHFCRWGDNGKVICFMGGQTEWSSVGLTCEYPYWRIPEEK